MSELQDFLTPTPNQATTVWMSSAIEPPASIPKSPRRGKVLFGKYRYEGFLGQGGMGMVFLVTHLGLGSHRALKLIPSRFNAGEQARKRLGSEAMANAAVSGHPNILQIHDAKITKRSAYIEMEFVRGRVLRKLLTPRKPLDTRLIATIVAQLCAAMEYAHHKGVVHKDLKPDNLMIIGEKPLGPDHLKVIDFGLAEFVRAINTSVERPLSGTPGYASPEQWLGNPIEAQADLFSTGVMLYRFLTGYLPFKGNVSERVSATLYKVPNRFSEYGRPTEEAKALEELVMQCLAKDPARRPECAADLGRQVASIMAKYV